MLKQHNILFHEQAVAGQIFFVKENGDMRTHHIHIVKWNGAEWNNYINFRDYLNAVPEKAMMYDDFKQKLAIQFSNDRKNFYNWQTRNYKPAVIGSKCVEIEINDGRFQFF